MIIVIDNDGDGGIGEDDDLWLMMYDLCWWWRWWSLLIDLDGYDDDDAW